MVKKLLLTSQAIFGRQQSSILSAAMVITVTSLVSAVLGLFKNRLLITYFFGLAGGRQELDAYWVAFRLPELVFQLLVIGSLSAAFIPVYARCLKKGREEASLVASSVMNIVLLGFAVASIVIFVFANQFIQLITSTKNFSMEQVILAAQLTKIMLLAQFFFAVSNFLTGMIQAEQRFLVPALSPAVYNLGIIIGIVGLTPLLGIYGPAVGVVIGALMHLVMQIPLVWHLGYRYQPAIQLKLSGVGEMLRLMPPRIFAISVNQIELFATVFFATALPAGSLTIMNIATQLISAPIRVFSIPIGQASLPFLSQTVAEKAFLAYKKTLIQSLHQILFLALPAGMLLLILRIPLVRLVYGAAEFPWSATLLTGRVVALLSVSLFAQAAIQLLNRGYYALHNTKLPLWIALIAVIINISVAFLSVFVYEWGVLGLAAGISLASLVQMGLLLFFLLPYLGRGRDLWWEPVKMMLATAVMGLCLWAPLRLLDRYVFDTTRVIPLVGLTLVVSLIGGVVYLGLAWGLNIPELRAFGHLLGRLGNWRQVLKQTEEVLE